MLVFAGTLQAAMVAVGVYGAPAYLEPFRQAGIPQVRLSDPPRQLRGALHIRHQCPF